LDRTGDCCNQQDQHHQGIEKAGCLKVDVHAGNCAGRDEKRASDGQGSHDLRSGEQVIGNQIRGGFGLGRGQCNKAGSRPALALAVGNSRSFH
jgi:hypothetical protein